jgi:hypothetical protein
MSTPKQQEEKVQYLADVLSLVAVVGRMEAAVMQRVLASLGNQLAAIQPPEPIDPELAARLVAEIATHAGEKTATHVASDIAFVAEAWGDVLREYQPFDPHELLPYAEIIFSLVNHTGVALASRNIFERFGGEDLLLPMPQLTAALSVYVVPKPNLRWEMIGFVEPSDQALIGSDEQMMYLFKSASSGISIRFSELERQTQDQPRHEHDVRVDKPMFAAFVAGLAGDLLYYASKMRGHAMPGHQVWERLQVLLAGEDQTKK